MSKGGRTWGPSPSQFSEVDAACDRFEAGWRAGGRPRIEEFLDAVPEPARPALLRELLAHVTRPEFVYRHEWREGDLVIWDNRCVLHRARPYDYRRVRVMRHTRVAGDPATELAATARDERAGAYQPSTSNR